MYKISSFVVALLLFIYVSPSDSQEIIDDRGQGTANHNYFVASQTEQLRLHLYQVTTHHIKPCPHSPEGTYHDIAIGRYDYAKDDIDYTLERIVNHPAALQLVTPVVLATKQQAWGMEKFEYALKWYPNYAVTHAQYGEYLVAIGSLPAGIEQLKAAVQMDPKLIAGYVWLNQAYTKQGNRDLAVQAGDKARALGYKGELLK